jgi:hypothetical protein
MTKRSNKPRERSRFAALFTSWVPGQPVSERKARRLQQMAERQRLGVHAPKSVREARRTDAGSGQGPAGMFGGDFS